LNSFSVFLCYVQLELYSEEHHLWHLQGDILPYIISVYVSPGVINIAMEPPHYSFWIEASEDMPDVLKIRCIEAFEKLHRRGVLHGNPELRHMLIGGDGKVTIIDFQMSRAMLIEADTMVLPADRRELELEMRKVKYKLDYEGARQRETAKMIRSWERDQRRRTHQTDGETAAAHHDILEEVVVEPPISVPDWNISWANEAANTTPRIFVIPGQSSENVAKEIQRFFTVIDKMSATGSLKPKKSGPRKVEFANKWETPPARNLKRHRPVESGQPDNPDGRKKRPRRSALIANPIIEEYFGNGVISEEDRLTPPRTGPAEAFQPVVLAPTNPSTYLPPVKVRDFVDLPYDGPRGYYAPYPYLENLMNLKWKAWVRDQRKKRCEELGLELPAPHHNSTIRIWETASGEELKNVAGKPIVHVRDKCLELLGLRWGLDGIKQTVMGSFPVLSQKRKRGDEETEILEADSHDEDRRSKKIRTNSDHIPRDLLSAAAGSSSYASDHHGVLFTQQQARRNGRAFSAGPSSAIDPFGVQHVLQRASRHGGRLSNPVAGPLFDPLEPRTMSRNPQSGDLRSDQTGFATPGSPAPAAQKKSSSNPHSPKSFSQISRVSFIPRSALKSRKQQKSHFGVSSRASITTPIKHDTDTDTQSEDDVELLPNSPQATDSAQPSLNPLAHWIGFLFSWL
jgi:hypothetical protein